MKRLLRKGEISFWGNLLFLRSCFYNFNKIWLCFTIPDIVMNGNKLVKAEITGSSLVFRKLQFDLCFIGLKRKMLIHF